MYNKTDKKNRINESFDIVSFMEGEEYGEKFKKEFRKFISLLNENDIDYALVGGLAYSYYVETRATSDADFMFFEDDYEEVKSLLEDNGYNLKFRSDKQIAVIVNTVPIKNYDLLFAVGFAPEGPAINRAKSVSLKGIPSIKIASPDDLIMLWCDAVADGHRKVYNDAEKLLATGKCNIEKIKSEIQDIVGSDAAKVFQYLLDGKTEFGESVKKRTWEENQKAKLEAHARSAKSLLEQRYPKLHRGE